MREIKFRLIRDGKVVGYEYCRMDYTHSIEWFYSVDGSCANETVTLIPHDAKEQFTGMVDKNERDAYKNDKVNAHVFGPKLEDGYTYKECVVIWEDNVGGWALRVAGRGFVGMLRESGPIEVIGRSGE